VVREFRKHCAGVRNPDGATGLPCAICTEPIDYRLPHWNPRAFQAHHDIPASDRVDLMLSWANLRPSHAICNQRLGRAQANPEDIDLGEPSEVW
jgi:hypothetical protein